MDELLEKYKGAYASDFEVPSASGSKVSSDSEVSGDEEEETEEDESDAESNTSSSGTSQLLGIRTTSCKQFIRCCKNVYFMLFKACLLHPQTLKETVQKKTVRGMRRRAKTRMMTVEGWRFC